MNALPPIANRIGPLIGKLGSPHDGEVLSAARALARLLDKHGHSFNDLTAALLAEPVTHIVYRDRDPEPVSDWCDIADWCANHNEWLSEKEADFIQNMCRFLRRPGFEPTAKQQKWLNDILDRIKEEVAA